MNIFPVAATALILTWGAGCAAVDNAGSETDQSSTASRLAGDGPWLVSGDPDIRVDAVDGAYRSGACRVDTPLPDGFPRPTPPGTIEIKAYPRVRGAQVTRTDSLSQGGMQAFFPLLQHIHKHRIEMTSPVVMVYRQWVDHATHPGEWTMSFLYRNADVGPTGRDGAVLVVDTPAVTVLSIGVQGPYGLETAANALDRLESWLDRQHDWVQAGDPRALNYNSPSVADRDKWSEVQIPIRPAK